MFEPQRTNQTHYQYGIPYGSSTRDTAYSYDEHIPRSSSIANSLNSRTLPLPPLTIRPSSQSTGLTQPCPLPPIQTAPSANHFNAFSAPSLTTSPNETSSSRSERTLSISDAGTTSSGDEQARRSSSTVTHVNSAGNNSSQSQPRASQRQEYDDDDDEDAYARRETLLPDVVIPPMYEYGQHIAIAQKQNCGRRTGRSDAEDVDVADPNKRRQLDKRNDHTNAERNRRNDHKNLAMDLYFQTPIKFLQLAGWHDHAKEPVKKVQLHAAVIYMHDLSKTCTAVWESEQKFKKTTEALKKTTEAQEALIARQNEEIKALTRKLEAQERRPSVSSKADSTVPDFSVSSSFKSEPPTPDGREMYSFMEPRVPASGPSTPAFSLRSSPHPLSRPVSRPSSPKALLPCPIGSNTDFQFPTQHKRKTEDQTWVILNKPSDQTDAALISPKRARF